MAKFVKVNCWSWRRYFIGPMAIHTDCTVTEDQVRRWIEQDVQRGASGNYDHTTLTCRSVKVKEAKVQLTKINDEV